MKLSYQKRFHPTEGTVYNQTISVTPDVLSRLNDAIQAEAAQQYPFKKEYTNGNENNANLYLKQLRRDGKMVYINHTQRNFINRFLKLPIKDRNTCLLIKK